MARKGGPIALGIDIRSRSFAAEPVLDQLERLGAGAEAKLLFLDCDDEVLVRRFTVTSFSYRGGLPREADLVFDARFLANPHYQPALRPLDGRDPRVAAYVAEDPAYAAFFEGLTAMLAPLLPRYEREGKSYLTIGIGCTGGRHRSVAVAERLAAWLAGLDRPVEVAHRDIAPGATPEVAPGAAPGGR